MRIETRYESEFRQSEDGKFETVEVPREKFIYEDEEKRKIVTEYYLSREPAQTFVELYKLSSKQILYSWMDKFLREETIPLPENNSEEEMAKTKNPEERVKELEAEKERLEQALWLEKLRSMAFDKMINLAEKTFNIPIRKKSGTKR